MTYRLAGLLAVAALTSGTARADDEIHFDPQRARAAQYVETYEAATDQCMRGRAAGLLYAGGRSKREIVSELAGACGSTLRRVYVERAGLSDSQADAAVEALAAHALRHVMLRLDAAQ